MMKVASIRTLRFLLIFGVSSLFLISCAQKERVAVSQLDTPGHHTYTGLKLLELGKHSDAGREFKMATQLDAQYSKAYVGMALVNIYTGKLDTVSGNLDEAAKTAQTSDEKLFVNVARIRYYTLDKSDPKWIDLAKKQFDEAVLLDSKHAPVYYYMGLAYKEGLDFTRAAKMFDTVIRLKTDHIDDANNEIKFLLKLQKANPTTERGKRIALTEKITRAETAALLMQELKIKNLYGTDTAPAQDQSGSATVKDSSEDKKEEAVSETKITGQVFTETFPVEPPPVKIWAKDIMEHPLFKDIESVLEAGVSGLENDPKGNFKPGEIISRGEFAIILEGILIRITGEKDLAGRYVNSKSLFPDVPSDMPYFNAITSVTSRGIMEAKNLKTNEFAPLKPLSGVEALWSINRLKEVLKIQ